jgi:preprotein translocase subunit Sec61beta
MAEVRKTTKKGEGFQSAAGLIRYFDAEDDKAIKIPPLAVFIISIVVTAIVGLASVFIPV